MVVIENYHRYHASTDICFRKADYGARLNWKKVNHGQSVMWDVTLMAITRGLSTSY